MDLKLTCARKHLFESFHPSVRFDLPCYRGVSTLLIRRSVRNALVSNTRKRVNSASVVEGMSRGGREEGEGPGKGVGTHLRFGVTKVVK